MNKPFNLQDALAGKPVVTRHGLKVLNIAHLPQAWPDGRVVTVLDGVAGNNVQTYDESGHVGTGTYDLFMAPTTVTKWINLYKDGFTYKASVHDSEAEANGWALRDRVSRKPFPITFEE